MRKIVFTLLFLLAEGQLYAQAKRSNGQIFLYSGYGVEDLQWSIAGNLSGENPNIYSELKWKLISGLATGCRVKWHFSKKLSLRAAYERMFIFSGRVSDRDYAGDDRTHVSYEGDFIDNKGHSSRWLAAFAYELINRRRIVLNSFIGYAEKRQSFFILDPPGRRVGLNSSYRTKWSGPVLGINVKFHIINKTTLYTQMSYSQLYYHGKADWNLIQSFRHPVSFTHYAIGYGINAEIRLQYAITPSSRLMVGSDGGYRETGKGIDKLYLVSGKTEMTRLNRVEGRELGFYLGYGYYF